ncbi:DUF3025 domain-containing protein [Alteromonas sp.]|uniref:DUF3025 domain-containing protein n=1 Tax=Alteromonas sp. TaxID=232 RepID=UPI000B74C32B|nr:DUF3025 domain-containing protein [Alteromonas sp.]MAI36393.1 hypothetical protein [Alteromonas sp.]OUX91326.1 MAG: hypothetical protein CBB95_02445 [Alteromonas sp. TMED35]|tara:strand:+ start:2352 stop:3230 length:879 start_codon:yes stop_codon:yes gene_type:complete
MQSTDIPFSKTYLSQYASLSVTRLLTEMNLIDLSEFPSTGQLNALTQNFHSNWQGPHFVAQSEFGEDESRYYETIIGEDNRVPTRESNWHDLFNALIWIQFPKTKGLLNTLHVNDINEFGISPRTARRNRITHFDECGVVLAVETPKENGKAELEAFLTSLATHNWHEVFIKQRKKWAGDVTPFIFGHANLEMMLNPFIGLTGKWLAVPVPEGFSQLSQWQQRSELDNALVKRITQLDDFQQAPILKPIPLLGVPGWHHPQSDSFYDNEEYFRPARKGAKQTIQLPLWSHSQ